MHWNAPGLSVSSLIGLRFTATAKPAGLHRGSCVSEINMATEPPSHGFAFCPDEFACVFVEAAQKESRVVSLTSAPRSDKVIGKYTSVRRRANPTWNHELHPPYHAAVSCA
jgi:hypothetical protein